MFIIIMYCQIKQALSLYQQQPKNQKCIGQLISLLRMVHEFHSLADAYGSAHLHLYLPHLSIITLLPRTYLFDASKLYFILAGELHRISHTINHKEEHLKDTLDQQYIGNTERIIDLNEQQYKVRAGMMQCRLLVVERGKAMKKKWENLKEKERERCNKYKQQLRLISKDEQMLKLKTTLMKVSPFSQLTSYDLCSLVISSHVKIISQSHSTHLRGSPLEYIGFILSGRIKNKEELGDEEDVDADEDTTKRARNKQLADHGLPGMAVQLKENDWIGLEEYFNGKHTMESSGVSTVIDTHILWIPVSVFQDVFSVKNNYLSRGKLLGITQTKQYLKQKNNQKNNPKAFLPQGLSQVVTLKCSQYQYKRKGHKKNRFSSNPKITLPDRILHRLNYNAQNVNLPSLPRVNMFQQQYDSTIIRGDLKRSIQQYPHSPKDNVGSGSGPGPTLKKDSSMSSLDRTTLTNPQTIYKHLYERISFKYDPRQQQEQIKNNSKIKSKIMKMGPLSTCALAANQLHFNASIANNFKAFADKQKRRQRNLSMYGKMNLDIQD